MNRKEKVIGEQALNPLRDKVQAIVNDVVKMHQRELSGWVWLQIAMVKVVPDAEEESALYEILSRARREFRY